MSQLGSTDCELCLRLVFSKSKERPCRGMSAEQELEDFRTLNNLQANLVSVTVNRVNISGMSFCSLLRRDRSVWMKCHAVFLVCLSKLLEYI